MNEQTAAAAAVPKRPLRFTSKVAEAIRAASYEGLKSLPQRGAEVGGLIVGDSVELLGTSLRIVRTEYLYGPSYRLSARDRPSFSQAVRECLADGHAVLAYFRSCTRPVVKVEVADEEAIAQLFPDIAFVVLAKPSLSGIASMLLFTRDHNGGWSGGEEPVVEPTPPETQTEPRLARPEPPQAQYSPREPQNLAPAPSFEQIQELLEPIQPLETLMAPPPVRREIPNWLGEWERLPRWFAPAVAPTVIVLLFLGALWLGRGPLTSKASPVARVGAIENYAANKVEPALGLEARPEDGMLHVTWNRNSAAARSAVAGVLKIADSDIAKLIPLSRSDVTGGSIEYASRSSDVTFRLQITGADGKSSEEMIRVLGNEPSKRETRPVGSQPSAPASAAPSPKIAAKPAAIVATPAVYREPPPTPMRIVSEPPAEPTRLTSQQATPIGQQVSIAQPVSSPQPVPSVKAGPGPGPAAANPTTATPGESSLGLPRVPATQSVLPPEPDPATSNPLSASVVTLPPQPLHSVKPLYTHPPTMPGTRPVLPSTPVTVAIVVSVDEKGKVLNAQRASDSPSKDAFLSKQALDAAKQWSFKPATRGGQPVAAEFRINFVFSYNQ